MKALKSKEVIIRFLELCCIIAIIVSVIHFFEIELISNNRKDETSEIVVEEQQISIDEFELKDFSLKNTTLSSLSSDPWMFLNFGQTENVRSLIVEIEEMSVEQIRCQVFYDAYGEEISGNNWVEQDLKSGTNEIVFPQNSQVKVMRIDLADQPKVVINVKKLAVRKNEI